MTDQRLLPHEHRPHVAYVLRDSEGGVLYVGITQNFPQRLKNHRSSQPWGKEVDPSQCWTSDPMPWEDALAVEEELIARFSPRHNKRRRNGSRYVDLGVRHLIRQERAERKRRNA